MCKAVLVTTLELPWTQMEPIRLGRVPTGRGTADRFVVVESGKAPLLRVDLYKSSEESYAFEQVCFWYAFVVIGWGHCVYLIEPRTRAVTTLDLGSYFGHLYPGEECLLVASAERLFRVELDGHQSWQSDDLGIDGVVVDLVAGDVIRGSGEWDPPGGWRPFQVNMINGQRI